MVLSTEEREKCNLDSKDQGSLVPDPSNPDTEYLLKICVVKISRSESGRVFFEEQEPAYLGDELGSQVGAGDDYHIGRWADSLGLTKLQLGLRCARFFAKIIKYIK